MEGSVVGLEGRGLVRVGGAARFRGNTLRLFSRTPAHSVFMHVAADTEGLDPITSFLCRSSSPTHLMSPTHPLTHSPCRWAARAW